MSWEIKGEAGKTLDATLRSFSSLLGDNWQLKTESLGEDEFSWTAATENGTGAGTIIPAAGQVIEVFYSGVRKFRGHVAMPRVARDRVTVKAFGPWWWMQRTPLTSTQTDGTGASGERTLFVANSQDVKTTLENLIDRMIAQGVPIIRGTVAAMYSIPKISIANMSCAQALADLMRWIPDAVAWFDYSGATGTNPILNISRRGVMTEQVFTVGTDLVEDWDLNPRLDLEVSRTELAYVTRQAVTGLPQWANQASGTDVAGKRQIITVSGPEIVDYLPPETSRKTPIYASSTTMAGIMKYAIPGMQKLMSDWSSVAVTNNVWTDPYTGSNAAKLITGSTFNGPAVASGSYQTSPSSVPSGKTAILLGQNGDEEAPEWMIERYGLSRMYIGSVAVMDGNNSGSTPPFDYNRRNDIYTILQPNIMFWSSTNPPSGSGAQAYAFLVREIKTTELPIYLINTADLPATKHTGTTRSGTNSTTIVLATSASSVDDYYNGDTIQWLKNGVIVSAVITDYVGSTRAATLSNTQQTEVAPSSGLTYTIPGSFQDPWTYEFQSPPSGLAANLVTAQSWVPWEGFITLVGDEVDGTNLLQKKFSLANAYSALATMAALPKSVIYDGRRKRTTINLGSPARTDFGSLVSRIRRDPKDNIIYL